MSDPLFSTPPAIVQPAKPQAENIVYSKGTVARLNETRDRLQQAKKSMLDDLSKTSFKNPLEVSNNVMELQKIETEINNIKNKVEASSTKDFNKDDVLLMSDMKKRGIKEEKIAEFFDTNQTKVNRFLNGSIKV